MPKISIKTNILIIFLVLVGIVSLSLLFSQYYFSKKLAIDTTHRTFKIISKNISEHVYREALSTREILHAKSANNELLHKTIDFNPVHPSFENLKDVLQLNDNFHAIYFADKHHGFYEIIHLLNRDDLIQTLDAPKSAHWAIITIINDQQQNAFLDKEHKLITKKVFSKKYNLSERPWYKQAIGSDAIITTQPYMFSNVQQMGITYALKLEESGVVLALDYTMDQLNKFLSFQQFDENSEVFIVNKKGYKYASSDFVESNKRGRSSILDETLMQAISENKLNEVLHHKINEINYYVLFTPLLNNNAYLGIKVDANLLFKPYKESIQIAMLIAFILLILALPIIYFSADRIVKPIEALIDENTKVKNRQFSEVKTIDTNIIEFKALSRSLVSLSQSVQSYERKQEELLDSIIKVIAEAIDTKSPYTGKHCTRVPEIAQMLLDAANNSNDGVFKSFSLTSKDEQREFEIGAWLHDCGKVTTPEYVVDKSTKLETIYNRIHEIRMRFEVLWRDAHIEYLTNAITLDEMHEKQASLRDDFAFIASCNLGGEFMDISKQERIRNIAELTWERHFSDTLGLGPLEKLRFSEEKTLPATETLLSDKTHHIITRDDFDHQTYLEEGFKLDVPEHLYNYGEIYNLCIEKGTLTEEERYKINEHVIMSIKMLEKIPFPSNLTKIPEYAGTHHETLKGTGYPRGLNRDELSIPARIMAIADIFEALTASDRPYKKPKSISESIEIMSMMVKDEHIDEDLFKLFLKSGVYRSYAQKHLLPEQIDDVDVASYLS